MSLVFEKDEYFYKFTYLACNKTLLKVLLAISKFDQKWSTH